MNKTKRTHRFVKGLHLLVIAALLAGLLSVVPVAYAATFDDVDSEAELESAINDANGNGEPDTITITADITLTGALSAITSTITIEGGGHTIDADEKCRVLHVGSDGDLTLQNITLTKGDTRGIGGGVYNEGVVTATASTILNNTASWGSGVYNTTGATLTVDHSTISDNTVRGNRGGGVYNAGTLTVDDSTISDNTASYGGGVCNEGMLTITGSEIISNTVDKEGGGGVQQGHARHRRQHHLEQYCYRRE